MRATIRLKYGLFRLLGVVSPSGRYPLPPRWALNARGKHRFYDAPQCAEPCCPWNRPPASCQTACCTVTAQDDAYGARTVQRDRDTGATVSGQQNGADGC